MQLKTKRQVTKPKPSNAATEAALKYVLILLYFSFMLLTSLL